MIFKYLSNNFNAFEFGIYTIRYFLKSRIWKTLYIRMCADSRTYTKMDRNRKKRQKQMSCVTYCVSPVTCHLRQGYLKYLAFTGIPKTIVLCFLKTFLIDSLANHLASGNVRDSIFFFLFEIKLIKPLTFA